MNYLNLKIELSYFHINYVKYLVKINYENYEIILVDNNSKDESIEFVKKAYPSVIIIKFELPHYITL